MSRRSDAFGFGLIGWVPPSSGSGGRAVCLEVKSSDGEGFHLSRNEWSVAEKLSKDSAGDRYAVLVVRRAKAGGVPAAMDLLSDPVDLVDRGRLHKEENGNRIAYRAPVVRSGVDTRGAELLGWGAGVGTGRGSGTVGLRCIERR